jgi:hypothetical protein
VTRAGVLYLCGLCCAVLGLCIAWLQAENHRLADRLQELEGGNLDLEVLNQSLDLHLAGRLHRVLAGDEPLDELPAEESETAQALLGEGVQ